MNTEEIKGNCIDCKHYKSEIVFSDKNEIKSNKTCLVGNIKEMQEFWVNNHWKIRGKDEIDNLPCFEENNISKSLRIMSNTLDGLKEAIDKTINQ